MRLAHYAFQKDDTFFLDTSDARSRRRGFLQTMPCQEEENEVKKYHKKIKALEKAPGALLWSA